MSKSIDDQILDLLEEGDGGKLDELMELVDLRLNQKGVMAKLRRITCSRDRNVDADEVLAMALEKGVTWLYRQLLGEETPFRFSRDNKVRNLDDWFLCIVGRPGAGARSGVVGAEIKRTKIERDRFKAMDNMDHEPVDEAAPPTVSADDGASRDLEAMIASLRPREQFVIRLDMGVHDKPALTAKSIGDIATASGFLASEVWKIRRRAVCLRLDPSKLTQTLTQTDIGLLLDVGPRQVRKLKTRCLEELRQT